MLSLPYYPRAPLDRLVIQHLDLIKGIAIFAPRRRGKTAFVHNELLPAAEAHRYRAVYIDLWRHQQKPELAIVEGLEAALPQSKRPWTVSKVKGGGKVKPTGPEVSAEIEMAPSKSGTDANLLARLNAAFDQMTKSRDRWLIVMDEFQTLAQAKEPGFVAALRAGTQRSDNIKLFVTGSARRQLSRMLTSQKSPFLGMLMQLDLPELDIEFIRARCALIKERSGRTIKAADLMAVFEEVARVPEYLNQIVSIIIVEGVYDPRAAFQLWRGRQSQSDAARAWETMSELDRLVLLLIERGPNAKMFREETLRWLAVELGEPMTTSKVQNALRRLDRAHLVEQGANQGEYEIGDDGMRLFLKDLPATAWRALPKPPK